MTHSLNWFEIPVTDFARAKAFYEVLYDAPLNPMEAMGMKSAFFPADLEQGAIGGCIMQSPGYEPSAKGTIVYLNVGEDLAVALSKVEAAGGKVLLPKTAIGANGFMAYSQDTEGNKVGMHSRK